MLRSGTRYLDFLWASSEVRKSNEVQSVVIFWKISRIVLNVDIKKDEQNSLLREEFVRLILASENQPEE